MDYLRRARRSRTAAGLTAVAVLMLFSFSVRAQPQERSVSPATPPAGNAESGKKLYNSVGCWTCHGYSGQGARTGARLAPNPLPFPIFVRYIRAPGGDMPPYTSKTVSDAQLADIYAFLKAIPRPRDAKEIPLLNQ